MSCLALTLTNMSSGYVEICKAFERSRMPEVEMLNKVGDRTAPCDITMLNHFSLDSHLY